MFFPQRDTSYTDHSSTPNFPSLCLSCLSPFTLKLSFSCSFRFVLWSAEFNQRHLWDHALGIFSRSLAGLAVATQLNIMVSPLSDSCNIQLFSSKQWVPVSSSPFYEWLLMWPASCRSNANSYSHMTQDCNDCTEYRGYHFWVFNPISHVFPSLSPLCSLSFKGVDEYCLGLSPQHSLVYYINLWQPQFSEVTTIYYWKESLLLLRLMNFIYGYKYWCLRKFNTISV